jgi:hypothetical protein
MKNATLLKIASLFIFLLSAQFSFGQTILTYDNFNQGFGNWNDPGDKCERLDSWWSSCLNGDDDDSGTVSVRLRKNTSSSRLISDQYDFSSYSQVKITYNFATSNAPDSGEGWFIEYSDDNGSNWETVKQYINGVNFTENQCVSNEEVLIEPSSTINFNSSQILLRFRNNMNHDNEQLWLDNIKVEGFSSGTAGTDILFSEDFSGYPENIEIPDDVDTITGSGTSATNPNGVSWSLTGPESANEIKLHHDGGEGDNGHIHTKKVNGTATFETDPITVSGYTGLNLKIYVDKLEKLDNDDTIELGYDLDGLGYTVIETITGYGDFTLNGNKVEDVTIDSDIIAIGDSLVIYIKITHNNNWDEKFEWDDITLTGTPFYNVWQGTNVDLVTDTAKWSKGSQPTEATNVWIPNTKHLKLIDDQAYNTVNARATSQLTIEKTGSLTTVGDFTKIAGTGAVTLNSSSTEFASIIVGGTATGDIKYNRFTHRVASWNWGWDLAGSPVLGLDLNDFYNTNTNDGTGGPLDTQGDIIALGTYNNEWDSWSLYTTSTIVNAGNFITGKGYQIAASIAGGNTMGQTIAYTGQIATQTQTTPIINNNGTNVVGKRWNLVANPFPSYIKANEHADPINNFIKVNENILDLNYGAIYGKRSDGTPGYIIYNNARGSTGPATPLLIAPGQGFLVAAASADVAQLQFTSEMRTVDGGDDFISGAPVLNNYLLNLKLFHGNSEEAETIFYFQQGLSDGLDPGYDAGSPNQAIPLSTRLTENDQGINFSINAMDIDAVNSEVIPLVINQQEGQPFRISISENTIPEDVNVYLEDTQNGTLTSLKDQDFELSAQEDLSDAGRFYIRFTTQNLAVNDVLSPSSLTVFKLNTDAFVTIQGLTPEMGKTTATLYNMLGMEIRSKTLNTSQSAQQISTQGLASGVYIINLKAGDQVISKKVIIQ